MDGLVQPLKVTGPTGLHFGLLCQEPTTLCSNCSTLRDGLGESEGRAVHTHILLNRALFAFYYVDYIYGHEGFRTCLTLKSDGVIGLMVVTFSCKPAAALPDPTSQYTLYDGL